MARQIGSTIGMRTPPFPAALVGNLKGKLRARRAGQAGTFGTRKGCADFLGLAMSIYLPPYTSSPGHNGSFYVLQWRHWQQMSDNEKWWLISGPKPCPINRWSEKEKKWYNKQERHKNRCKKRALERQQALEEAAARQAQAQAEAKDEPGKLEPWMFEPKLEPWKLEPKLEPWELEPKVEGVQHHVELMLSVDREQVKVMLADPIVRAVSEEVTQVIQ
jgi:hypothetical protein